MELLAGASARASVRSEPGVRCCRCCGAARLRGGKDAYQRKLGQQCDVSSVGRREASGDYLHANCWPAAGAGAMPAEPKREGFARVSGTLESTLARTGASPFGGGGGGEVFGQRRPAAAFTMRGRAGFITSN